MWCENKFQKTVRSTRHITQGYDKLTHVTEVFYHKGMAFGYLRASSIIQDKIKQLSSEDKTVHETIIDVLESIDKTLMEKSDAAHEISRKMRVLLE